MILNEHELLNVVGGFNITGTIINAFSRAITTLLDLGRSLGTSIRRIGSNSICQM